VKATVIHEFGDFDVLKYEDIESPRPPPGSVLVKVLAAGVELLDHYIRQGSIAHRPAFPHVLGSDASGEVAELGQGVSGLKVGERVIVAPGYALKAEEANIRPTIAAPTFVVPGLHIPGAYAQFMQVPDHAVVKDETGLQPEESATLPMPLATAVHSVKQIGGVKARDKVVIHSSSGVPGSTQIQVAKALGANVATTVRSKERADFVRSIGADRVINTESENMLDCIMAWTNGVGADVVVASLDKGDPAGRDLLLRSARAVKPMGTIVASGFALGPDVKLDVGDISFPAKRLRGSSGGDVEDLNWGLEQVRGGRIEPLLEKVMPLSRAGDAHSLISSGRLTGNIVLLPWSE
jgi:NADPH:quinone reductase-like Zn-dependent oxidoreductase